MHSDVFDALANPIGRDLLDLLRTGPKPVKTLASGFARGRPAISEHLKVLRDAGLLREEPPGRENYYHLDARPLRGVGEWLAAYQTFWRSHLSSLSDLLNEESP